MSHKLESGPSKDAADDYLPFEDEGTTDDEQQEAEGLHDASVEDTEVASPARFHVRLRTELRKRGITYDALPRRTGDGEAPPCFVSAGADYDAWLAAASHLGAVVPYRYDEPAEPNYCIDCTAAFRAQARKDGTCLYPNAKFEKVQSLVKDGRRQIVETEVVCVSRNKQKVIAELHLRSLLE